MSDFQYPGSNSTYYHQPSSSAYTYNPYATEQQSNHEPSSKPIPNSNYDYIPNNNFISSSLQSQIPSVWNPAVAATLSAASNAVTGNPNVMLDMGLKAGQTFLDLGTARMIPGLEKTMRYLRVYFAVNNAYVSRKMKRVLFSFVYPDWKRLVCTHL